jgi:NADPH-dependent ferric siderophore reductase
VLRTERLSPSLVRVVLAGDDLAGFEPVHADSYVKLLFLHPDVEYTLPLDVESVRASMPADQWPRQRSYTVRAFDAVRRELTVDLVVHGGSGLAGPWAAAAAPGDVLHLTGPGGGYSPDPSASWHLLVADESALPAVAVALERVTATTPVHAYVEVDGPDDQIPLARPVTWVHRAGRPVGQALLEAATAGPWQGPDLHAFVHGEAGWVKAARHWLRVERGVPLDRLSISGYWRAGADDEGWRASKAQWNAEVAADESGQPV